MAADSMRALLDSTELRGLVAAVRGEPVAFSLYALYAGGDGYIATLATAEAQRGRGIGAALVARTAKRLFAEGARHVRLRTEEQNAGAIRFYRRLGFRQTAAGRDYVRPTDSRQIERMKAEKRGTLIKFGGWR
jgi:ribosomal protein S18 acetylase RimI-like enzyme